MNATVKTSLYHRLFVGLDTQVPLLNGKECAYINFDNAASTPSFVAVQKAVDSFLVYYSSVHRGTGFKSKLSTHFYEESRRAVLNFLGADARSYTCIFVKNATEGINKLSRRFKFNEKRNTVLTTGMEHHSNDLTWRAAAHTIHCRLLPDGRLDEADFDAQLDKYRDQVALVAVTGASNVTGFLNPIHRLAEKAHAAGAQIVVDCAQLAPHRKIEMLSMEDPAHLDYITLSAHKMYAPFGSGALVGRLDTFESGEPDMRGGGTVDFVTLDDVIWAEPPERDEAGSPNTVGAVALAAAIHQLETVGMDAVACHEAELTAYALDKLRAIPEIALYGDTSPYNTLQRVGVIPLAVRGVIHFLVASILGYEFGIGVRNGCFCAHPYILHLLNLNPDEAESVRASVLAGDRRYKPGLVRISFGLYNSFEEIDILAEALTCIARGNYKGKYIQDKATGEYQPVDWQPEFGKYFSFSNNHR
ncbi:MAG: aminotransferase class V-fold PLP-dependent enzyme [Omnitrophica WOR_2 bacterium]